METKRLTPQQNNNEPTFEENETLIPFINRKCLLLSVSFRSLNLEMSEYKMKIESLNPKDLKEPLITSLCDTTMVIIKNNFNLNLYL